MLSHYRRYMISTVVSLCLIGMASAAVAEVKYGPPVRGECRPLRSHAGVGSSPALPRAGGKGAQECEYCQEVQECTRIDRLRPFRCVMKRPKCQWRQSGW